MSIDIQKFLDIEKKYDLYHKRVEGIQCWQYIRFKLWNYSICTLQLGLASARSRQNKVDIFVNMLGSFFYVLFHPQRIKLHSADICFLAHERRVKYQGKYECIYTDKLAEYFAPNTITLENPFRMGHLRPAQTKNLYYTDLISIKATFKSQIHILGRTKYYHKIHQEVHRLFREPIECIIQSYNLKIEADEIEKQLTKIALECQNLKRYYSKLLNKVHPKVIVEVVGYAKRNMVINELAKEMDIITIELQHGTIHNDHAAYQYAGECGRIDQFPNVLFIFSDYWKHFMNIPIEDQMIKTVGYPYFERRLEQHLQIKKTDSRIGILFISQGTIGKQLSELAVALSMRLSPEKYQIMYKLHPEEITDWRERYPWLLETGIKIEDNLERNIYECFANSDIQVGVYSTAIYEGLGFGLTTYIYHVGHANTMKELCEHGYARFVNTAAELEAMIINGDNKEKIISERFWKQNSLMNMCREINSFMNESENKEKMI